MTDTLAAVTGDQARAMAWSYLRVFLAASLGVFLTLGRLPLDLTRADLKAIINAGLAALLLTLYNYVRAGDSRFGHTKPDEPEVVLLEPDTDSFVVVREEPEQTDNRPKPEDGEQLPLATALNDVEWSGQEMR